MSLSDSARRFLIDVVGSVEVLDLLLFLRRTPDTFWTPAAAAEMLGVNVAVAQGALEVLDRAELLQRGEGTGSYRYSPTSPESQREVDALAAAMITSRSALLDVLYSRPC